jgi:UPF0716 protein FxsA
MIMRLPFLPVVLLAWPLAEIAGFVLVGKAIGLWGTLGLVLATGLIGALMIRGQGMTMLRRLSTEGREGRMPAADLVSGAMVVVAGILLMLPGFLTDIVGLALLVPFIRKLIWSAIGSRVVVVNSGDRRSPGGFRRGPGPGPGPGPAPTQPVGSGPVVDLDDDDYRREPNPSSPWADKDKRIEP